MSLSVLKVFSTACYLFWKDPHTAISHVIETKTCSARPDAFQNLASLALQRSIQAPLHSKFCRQLPLSIKKQNLNESKIHTYPFECLGEFLPNKTAKLCFLSYDESFMIGGDVIMQISRIDGRFLDFNGGSSQEGAEQQPGFRRSSGRFLWWSPSAATSSVLQDGTPAYQFCFESRAGKACNLHCLHQSQIYQAIPSPIKFSSFSKPVMVSIGRHERVEHLANQ